MPFLQLILVAMVQGITEFLPISSSGHLILLPTLTDLQDQGQLIDVAVHVGTLGAVVLYFWRDVKLGLGGLPRLLTGHVDTPGARLALGLIIATIPVVIAGAILHFTGLSTQMRNVTVIGWSMLIFGIVLYFADQKGGTHKQASDWSTKDALIMGLWQVLSLIPGTSRSGITITGARLLGYNRQDAARLSMLMSIPTIIASGVLLGSDAVINANSTALRDSAIACGLAFICAIVALTVMMRLLNRISFTPYVIYRAILGVALLAYAYGS